MTTDQIIDVIGKYEAILESEGAVPRRIRDFISFDDKLDHLAWMCHQIRKMKEEGTASEGKMFRWLGFIQGSMWAFRLRTIDQMRDDNR